MNWSWVKPLYLRSRQFMIRNASHLLMAVGTMSSLSAVISASKMAPKAQQSLYNARVDKTVEANGVDYIDAAIMVDRGREGAQRLNPWEYIKAVWRYYGPAAAMELLALFCFWAAHGIDIRRQAVWAGIAATAEETLREYQKKVQEMIGKQAEKEIRNGIAEDKTAALPPPKDTVILAESADIWCLIDGQYFQSSWVKIKDAQNDANHEMIQNMYISQAELYWLLDPDKKWLRPGPNSGQIGWSVDNMLVLDMDYGFDPNHKPILVISYRDKDGLDYPPQAGFSKMF